ncbi:MAG TPA: sulfite exporter TauE/SafE family protein [Alphaproteobacteria bacterium]|nr:sulfite exporter TauE/SafE family protein [Alphaproteobacteria bacterium]
MISTYLLLAAAAFVAGAMNSAAGGGTFVTFPALVFTGVPSVAANATSTVALFPGAVTGSLGYIGEFRDVHGVSIRKLLPVSIFGGFIGAMMLLLTPVRLFDSVVPWLLLLATLAFAFGPKAAAVLREFVRIGPVGLFVTQFFLAIYGGYFGGAVGLMTLAVWSLFGASDLRAMNAAKTLLVGSMNTVAVVSFAVAGLVWWGDAAVMAVAAALGGYAGAQIARRVPTKRIRFFINCVNATVTAIFFYRAFG